MSGAIIGFMLGWGACTLFFTGLLIKRPDLLSTHANGGS